MKRTLLVLALAALMAFAVMNCGDSGDGDSASDGGTRGDKKTPALVSISVTPQNPSVALSATRQFQAVGTYDDSTTKDITPEVSWSTANEAVATVAGGLATGVSSGTTLVTATDPATGKTGTTGLSSGCTASVTNSGPVSSGTQATVTLSLSCSSEATSYGCQTGSARICISGPEDFESDTGPFTVSNAALAACGANGVTATNCTANNGTPDVLEFSDNATGTATAGGIGATGFTDLQVNFTAAFNTLADSLEGITVSACCDSGGGCTPAGVGYASNGSEGGSDEWSQRGPVNLDAAAFDNCPALTVVFSQTNAGTGLEVAHMDDFSLSGVSALGFALSPAGGGTYTGGFAACGAATVPVSCTWGTANGTFSADNTTDVTFN